MNQRDSFESFFLRVNRSHSWDVLERAYAAYAAGPTEPGSRFAALRAIVKMCRLHDLGSSNAAMFAELGRVDDEARSTWQILIQRRKPTRPKREKQTRDKELRVRSRAQSRRWRRFIGVMDRIQVDDTLRE